MNLKIMRLVPGFRYSSVAAPPSAGPDGSVRLTVDAAQQIPRRPGGATLRRGVRYSDGLRLDLYTPTGPGRHPLVVYLPGGGFVVANRGMARRERAYVAAAGHAVASIEYRTTRQHATYRDALTDIDAAIKHLTGHADTYGIDPGRIALWGESAGGYLASVAEHAGGLISVDYRLAPEHATGYFRRHGAGALPRVAPARVAATANDTTARRRPTSGGGRGRLPRP